MVYKILCGNCGKLHRTSRKRHKCLFCSSDNVFVRESDKDNETQATEAIKA